MSDILDSMDVSFPGLEGDHAIDFDIFHDPITFDHSDHHLRQLEAAGEITDGFPDITDLQSPFHSDHDNSNTNSTGPSPSDHHLRSSANPDPALLLSQLQLRLFSTAPSTTTTASSPAWKAAMDATLQASQELLDILSTLASPPPSPLPCPTTPPADDDATKPPSPPPTPPSTDADVATALMAQTCWLRILRNYDALAAALRATLAAGGAAEEKLALPSIQVGALRGPASAAVRVGLVAGLVAGLVGEVAARVAALGAGGGGAAAREVGALEEGVRARWEGCVGVVRGR
ncbi:hypothetical protein NpNSSI1_00008271 [Neofusicoccum parvum]|nr:hypothetical protein NpNSSI1_00008271 [Neofusicoccum parvum]